MSAAFRIAALSMVIGLLMAGCGPKAAPTPVPTPSPASTPVPFEDRDLSALNCLLSDSLDEFQLVEQTSQGSGAFYEENMLGIAAFHRISFKREEAAATDYYTCYLYVFNSDRVARQVFPYSSAPATNYALGEAYNSVLRQIAADTYDIEVMWLYREVIAHVVYLGRLTGTKEQTVVMVSDVAEAVQARLAAAGK